MRCTIGQIVSYFSWSRLIIRGNFKVPLIIGVVFIHTYGIGGGPGLVSTQMHTSLFYISNQLFSQIIGRIAVPLFFLMSGYLFFLNTDFDFSVYKKKLKSRFYSLLIPYLFWNAAFIFIYFLVNRIPYVSSYFQNAADYNFSYFIDCFWGKDNGSGYAYPIVYPFWFIRDLMLVILFTPLLFYFLKHTRVIGLVILGLCWYLNLTIPYIEGYGFSSVAWFFFSLGAYFSINKKNLINEFSTNCNYIYLIYFTIAIIDLVTINSNIHIYIHNLGILFGVICCFKISAYLIDKQKVKCSSFLSQASFFIFAVHEPWILDTTRKLIYKFVDFSSDLKMTLIYYAEVIITVCISLLLYYFLKKTIPRFTSIISGGR